VKARDEVEDDADRFGLVLVGFDDDDDSHGIWPDNVPAVAAFLRVQTQWTYVCPGDGSVRRAGLDYQGARAAFDLAGVEMTPDLFAELQVIEAGVLSADHGEIDW
jgi:hypothetical protein